MANAFTRIAFTENVKTVQAHMGSREAYARDDHEPVTPPALGQQEIAFIGVRDSFYLGTVGETGWPYVQHRGGPAGFLKVLDEHTIGYADFTGNRQYISVGNVIGDDRVSLFLMDYPNQVRLKIFGRARIVDEASDAELLGRLENPHYRARVERGIVIHIEGFDWNCPKYIKPRYTEEEVTQRIAEASAALASNSTEEQVGKQAAAAIGRGELSLVITGVRQMTPAIRAYELRSEDGRDLPLAEAGAHIEVPALLADGTLATRQYSLTSDLEKRNVYEIAVQREREGRGGSQAIHETWQLGTLLRASRPINHFPLHADSRPAVLIAGGIGITPIKVMAQALKQRKTPFELHYTGKFPAEMAYRESLAAEFPSGYYTYFSRVPGHHRMQIADLLKRAADDAVFYVCGPAALIESVLATAKQLGIARERVQFESFN
jgi:ferredoxin-NADP reductase/predicted pyridoxine 5'-phosphate oxidase superfamily flavin-nucleotide-binding protein